ncbi:MFS transporter [Eggerthella sp. YY7918]|uniref:MFS transporter n=1 Tax=Eggerthella sp. (strain YY7918) TaxID=502558 RepID=UPI0002171710|nr:MFS transporter [Eggerthella sp. YY7918]BAK44482.1 permease of the major facilitator superfamily [Eggerthella sp. YY7918]
MEKKFIGWRVVVATGLLYALLGNFGLAAAQLAIPAMAVDPSVAMNRSMIGLGFTVFILMQGLPGPLIGKFIAKYGARKAFIASAALIIATGILMGLFAGASTVAYVVLFGVLLSFSCTLGGQIATQTTVGSWFVMKRGLAMAVTMGLGGLVAFAFPLITNAAMGPEGNWHMGFYLISLMALVALIIAFIFMKDKPEDVGQLPDGGVVADAAAEDAEAQPSAKQPVSKVYKTLQPKTSKAALRSLPFWLIWFGSFSVFVALNLAVSSGVLYFAGLGLDTGVIAGAVAVQGIAAVAVNLVIAPLADRIEPARILGVCALLTAIGAFLAFICAPGSVVILYAYYILLGIGFGGNTSVMPTAFANYFGIEHFPKIMGMVLLLLSVFSALVPVIAGVVFDAIGVYTPMFMAVAIIGALGGIAALLVPFPKKG